MWPLKIHIPKPPWLSSKESSCNAGDVEDSSSIPGSGRSPRGGNGKLLQYSCLENPMDRGAWQATVHRVARSRIQLSDWVHTHSHRHTHTHAKTCISKLIHTPLTLKSNHQTSNHGPRTPTAPRTRAPVWSSPQRECREATYPVASQPCFTFDQKWHRPA